MCGVFRLPETDEMLLRLERIYGGTALLEGCVLSWDVYPGNVLPVIARGKSGSQGPFLMQWGFHLPGSRQRLINARSETAAVKPAFSASLANRRCLIPMAGYYEWMGDQSTGKQKFTFVPDSRDPCYLAGLYRYEADPLLPRFTILTRQSAPDIAYIHPRMPLILSGCQAVQWLSPDADPSSLLRIPPIPLLPARCG